MRNYIRLLGQHYLSYLDYWLLAVCTLIKSCCYLPAVVHTLKTGDLTLLMKKKLLPGQYYRMQNKL